MKRGLIAGVFILLVLVGVVYASMSLQSNGDYKVSVNVKEGWNIIAGAMPEEGILASSEIQLSDIKAMWYYSPKLKEYIRVHPNPEVDKLQQADDDIVLTSAMWIYSEKSGVLDYSTLEDYPSLEERQLLAGWNFMTVTLDMTVDVDSATEEEKELATMRSIVGDCDFERVYHFEQTIQAWSPNLANDDFMDETLDKGVVGFGLLVKVPEDCNLGRTSGDVILPPIIPGGDNTGLRLEIEQYIFKELSHESCELNNAQNFVSVDACMEGISCLAEEYPKLVANEDLQDLADNMAQHGGEMGVIDYDEAHPSVKSYFESEIYSLCLTGRHNDYLN